MSIERGKEYYDDIYSREDYQDKYLCHYSESQYYELWKKIIQKIPNGMPFIELGCGTGQFAKMLADEGFNYLLGIDFSGKAIKIAKKNCPELNFVVADITTSDFNEESFFVATEVFEHVKDYKLIENIGLGKEIIFTVPDFNDASHVRYFKSVAEIVDRYKNVINFEYIEKFQHWFICKGVTI